ncbi:MAG: hypothetical protein KGL53_08130, partial [Elusimicrobia bacterium]|nr:hypothetical protein [Elusimicrobiota bacterium]
MGTSLSELPAWAACAAALAVPWLCVPGLRDWLILPKELLAAAAACAGLAAWAASGAPALDTGLEWPLAALAACAAVSAAFAVDPVRGFFGPDLVPEVGLCGLAAAVSGFYLGASAERGRPGAADRVAAALCLGAVPVSLLALRQAWLPGSGPLSAAGPMGRSYGTFGHPVALGSYLALVFPIAAAKALGAEGRRRAAWA